jgi:hypothetical protein
VLTVVDRSIDFLNCACIPESDKECLLGRYSLLVCSTTKKVTTEVMYSMKCLLPAM